MITYSLENDIATIQLDDGKANVFSLSMSEQLQAALSKAAIEAKVTILKGRDGQFSAGYDLKVMQSGDSNAMIQMVLAGFETLYQMASHPQPLIAACTGNAMGIGAFTLLVADTRIGIKGDYKACLPETRAGMTFPPLLVTAAKDRLNPCKYVEAALYSMPYSPDAAVTAGFLDTIVAPENFDSTLVQVASQLAALPTGIYARNKLDLHADKLAAMRANLDEIKANPSVIAN